MRSITLVLLLCAAGLALDVPAGKMPVVDGVLSKEEWLGAARLQTAAGTAYLLTAGRVLCIGVEMRIPYRGERIDLHVSDDRGKDYTWHAFHPASTLPGSPYPVPPVIARRASFSLRGQAPMRSPRACLFRTSVYRRKSAWSVEIAIELDALEAAPHKRMVFRIEVLHPDRGQPISFLPGGLRPETWPPLGVVWNAAAPRLDSEEEDARRALELKIFQEMVDRFRQRPIRNPTLSLALDGKKNNKAIEKLLEQLRGCVKADPNDIFARWSLVYLLRRANRIDDARAELDAMQLRFPYADQSWIVTGARRTLLLLRGRFRDAMRLALPGANSPQMRAAAQDWDAEVAARTRDRTKDDLPRIAFETTKGRVVVELLEDDAPNAVAHVIHLVEAGYYDGAVFAEVTGGTSADVEGEAPAARIPDAGAPRKAWRGAVALRWAKDKTAGGGLSFATGHTAAPAVGRIVEGMAAVDALEVEDRIETAKVVRKRDHPYEVRRVER